MVYASAISIVIASAIAILGAGAYIRTGRNVFDPAASGSAAPLRAQCMKPAVILFVAERESKPYLRFTAQVRDRALH